MPRATASRHSGVHKDRPEPAERYGPRPLALHLATAMTTLAGNAFLLPAVQAGALFGGPLAAERLPQASGVGNRAALAAMIEEATGDAEARLRAVLQGIETYHSHPHSRDLPEPPEVWREGSSRVLDYGADNGGRPVLFVPSLINRGYVLDVSRRSSMLRWLAAHGLRPLLVEWGAPGQEERAWNLSDYIAGRLERVLDAVLALVGHPVGVTGYCMGGNLSLALALRRQSDISRLALLATPWDFHASDAAHARMMAVAAAGLDPVMEAFGELPVDVLQAFFAALDPTLVIRKFTRFGRLDPCSPEAENFVALEDWLNDGVPLAAPVARECLLKWYGENTTANGAWRVAGEAVRPEALKLPALVAVPQADRIVPPASALALADAVPGSLVLRMRAGHIGMVVGRRAEAGLWRPLADWFLKGVESS